MASKSRTTGGSRRGQRRGAEITAVPVGGSTEDPGKGPGPVTINGLRPQFSPVPFAIGGDAPTARGADGARTVVLVHGVGNKPLESVLKCQWDTALFGNPMGDRTRLAYWVNRGRYPEPVAASCGMPDTLDIGEVPVAGRLRALAEEVGPEDDIALEIAALCQDDARRRNTLEAIAGRMEAAAAARLPGRASARILPGGWLRQFITPWLTKAFLRDVHDFLYVREERNRMAQSLMDRLTTGGGPFVVVAHSQGSMIAYEVLRRLKVSDIQVDLFVTIGSPLGIQEVQDRLRDWDGGKLDFPACVKRWVNVADPRDIVAIDATLNGEFADGVIEDVVIENPERADPHSGTGYLSSSVVREAVREATRSAFAQRIAPFVIAGNLVDRMEDGPRDQRHPVLIQLAGRDATPGSVDVTATGDAIEQHIRKMLSAQNADVGEAELDRMRRFIAARLTRREIEALRSVFRGLQIEGIWWNAQKRALIARSRDTVQARPANLGYGAEGQGICWAVLDTGIRADHPHFSQHSNIIAQYDCSTPGQPQRLLPGESRFAELDGHGHGTHVAGIIAGTSEVQEGNEGAVTYAGMAPRCKLIGFKVLGDDGTGSDAAIIKALDTIALLNEQAGQLVVHGVNLSLGSNFDPSVYGTGHTPLCQELRRLWNQGVVVTIAAGNEGFANLRGAEGLIPANMDITIGDPANLEEAIAVGSVHRTNPHTYGISYFSSRGPTADGRRKPDLVAPGERILSARHDWKRDRLPKKGLPELDTLLAEMSGTSMAAPHVAGVIAAFLSLRREFIGYPEQVKRILLEGCVDLRRDPYMQGAGLPNLIKMLALN